MMTQICVVVGKRNFDALKILKDLNVINLKAEDIYSEMD